MKYFIISLCLILTGCTSPGQRIANQEMTLGLAQSQTIYQDMGRLARQHILDKAAEDISQAVKAEDVDKAKSIVQDLFNTMQQIGWLDVQWERSRAVLRDAHKYIIEQQGILSLYYREWKEAKEHIDSGMD